MSDLVEFLAARLDEDEARARAFLACEWSGLDVWGDGTDHFLEGGAGDPTRVLAEVAAKRAIVGLHNCPHDEHHDAAVHSVDTYDERDPCATLRHLAAVYADHEDYDEEGWRV